MPLLFFVPRLHCTFNSIFNDYNLDDELVTNNQALTSQGWKVVLPDFSVFSSVQFSDSSLGVKVKYFLPQVFRSLYYQDKSGYKYEYRPLVQASFAIEHAIFAEKIETGSHDEYKDNPHISHFINVILYAITCVLLFLLLARLLDSVNIIFPFIVTILFVAHPIHTEVVASIKNRDEIMALMFALVSNIYAFKFAERRKPLYLFLLALAFLLSLLSKPTAITFAMLIPMALIMFTSVSYTGLMIVTVIVALLAAFYARFFFVRQQLELFVIVVFAVSTAYAALHFRAVWQQVKTLFNTLTKIVEPRNSGQELKNPDLNFGFLRNPIITFAITAILVALTVLAGFAAHQNWYWLSCSIGLVLALAYIFLRDEEKIILITPITIIVLLQLYSYKIYFLTPQIALAIFLCNHLFSGNRYARIIAGINYLLFILVGHFTFHTGILYPLLGLGILGFYYPRWLFMSVIGLIVSVYYEGFFVYQMISHGRHFNLDVLRWPLYQLGLILTWRGKKQWALNMAVVSLPVLMLVFVMVHPPSKKTDLLLPLNHTVSNFNYAQAIDPTPVQSTVRPFEIRRISGCGR